jgi:hypothetical protein
MAGAAVLSLFSAHALPGQTSYAKQFVTPQPLTSVNEYSSGQLIGAGDLNGDGHPDILYQNSEEIATGNGTFRFVTLSHSFVAGSMLADVNGDGKLDVIEPVPADEECDYNPDGTPYCNIYADAELVVYFGKGDGAFTSGTTLDLGQEGAGTAFMVVADLNGDGKRDVVVSFSGNSEDSSSLIDFALLNDGKGNFRKASSWGYQQVLATGDFNGDGNTDLAVQNNGVTILLGKGDGTFTTGQSYTSVFPSWGASGDFNHDGKLDLAIEVPADSYPAGSAGVYVLWGKGNATFSQPQRITSVSPGGALTAVDLNHDGYLDLLAGDSTFSVMLNQRNGTFANPHLYQGPYYLGGAIALADFNHDGYLDVASGNSVTYGAKNGTFVASSITQAANTVFVAVGDFNRDGIDDVASLNSSGTVSVFLGTGQGYFNAGQSYNTGIEGGQIAVGDVNGDGSADLAVTRGNQMAAGTPGDVAVLLGKGDGTFRALAVQNILGKAPSSDVNRQIYAIDVNHDGKADLIGDWGVALSNGDGTFAAPKPFPSAIKFVAGIAAGDFNKDGNVDLVVGNYIPAEVFTLLGDGKGGFTVSHEEKLNYTSPLLDAIATADMNGDGNLDLVYLYSAAPSEGSYDRVVVETGDGKGNFGNATGTRVDYNGYGYDELLVSDFNRDGKPDVFVLTISISADSPTLGESEILFGAGGGELSAPQYFLTQMYSGAVINLNQDDAPDVVGPNLNEQGVERVLNTNATE